jgi:hypothetical protein
VAKKKRSHRPKPKSPATPAANTAEAGDADSELEDRASKTDDRPQPSSASKSASSGGGSKSGAASRSAGASAKSKKVGAPQARVTKPVPEPAFWFGFEVTWSKLVAARIVVFSLLALDALLQIRHAPRYGAGDFNVAQLGFLDSLGPGRVAYGAGQLAIALACTLAVFNVATRIVVPIAAVIYAWLYFGSQLDSYQHHYLVALVLGIASFVPWCPRPVDAQPDTRVRSWAVRLLLVQLAIMYLWAAISKLDPVWLDGTTLGSQITGGLKSMIDSTVGFRVAAILVIVVELALAATIWIRPAWPIAAPIGLLFHLGIVATGFEIGLFAYVMCALYILVIPDGVWVIVGDLLAPLGRAMRKLGDRPGWAAIGAGVAVAIALAVVVRLPHALAITICGAVLVLVLAARRVLEGGPPIAKPAYGLVAALLLWLIVDRASTVAVDYYRFWGGSQRRIGDKAQSEEAYRKLIDIAPNQEVGHYQLARLLLASDRVEEGLAELRIAQRVQPDRARAFTEEARWLARQGKQAEAVAKAKEAVFADPSDGEGRALLDQLTGGTPAKPSTPGTDPD